MASKNTNNSMGIGILLVAAVVTVIAGCVGLTGHSSKKAEATASTSASASATAIAYPEATTNTDGTVEIAVPAAVPSAEANVPEQSDPTAVTGSTAAYTEQTDPETAIAHYLNGSGLIDGLSVMSGWVDIDLSSHTDISDKFTNLHTFEVSGTWKSDVKFGDVTYAKGDTADITAYVTYDSETNTSTIHTLVVNSISFIADGYVDESMYGYMFG